MSKNSTMGPLTRHEGKADELDPAAGHADMPKPKPLAVLDRVSGDAPHHPRLDGLGAPDGSLKTLKKTSFGQCCIRGGFKLSDRVVVEDHVHRVGATPRAGPTTVATFNSCWKSAIPVANPTDPSSSAGWTSLGTRHRRKRPTALVGSRRSEWVRPC